MLALSTSIALALALAPPLTTNSTSSYDAPNFDIVDAEVVTDENAVHLVTYDEAGDVSSSVVFWIGDDGRGHLAVDFADGLYLSVIVDEQIESNDPAEVAVRLAAIDDYLDTTQTLASGWRCGVSLIAAAGFCAGALVPPNAIGCMGAAAGIACECVPLVWEDVECY